MSQGRSSGASPGHEHFDREDDRIASYDNCQGRTLSALASSGNEKSTGGSGVDLGSSCIFYRDELGENAERELHSLRAKGSMFLQVRNGR